jgi:hypothetical protein
MLNGEKNITKLIRLNRLPVRKIYTKLAFRSVCYAFCINQSVNIKDLVLDEPLGNNVIHCA